MKLFLEDGSVWEGKPFGAPVTVEGEVVFNTGMTGYVETLTDPSYKGQILVLTYPLQGNYGVPAPVDRDGLPWPQESDRIQVAGLVVCRHSERHSHHAATQSLGQWLSEARVPAVEGVDTRSLTRKLREKGTMTGWLAQDGESLERARAGASRVPMERVVDLVSRKDAKEHAAGRLKVAVVDCGVKRHIVRSLIRRGIAVTVVPWNHDLASLANRVDGFFLSNGPGDPKDARPLIENVKPLLDRDKPVFGICLGNQILALAAGADTYKLKYGHRSQNQPVQDLFTRRCYVTSQNHGYAVDPDTLPPGWDAWFVNLNDGTNEGIRCLGQPFASVQFHPEASPGPVETGFLFDEFARMLSQSRLGHAR